MQEPQKPTQLVAEDKYIDLLVELQLLRSYGDSKETDSLTIDSLTSVIFDQYNVSDEVFWTSHNYYQKFPAKQKKRVEEAIDRLKMDKVSNTARDTASQN